MRLPAQIAAVVYADSDSSQIKARLMGYIRAITDIDDREDDPYPDLERIVDRMLGEDPIDIQMGQEEYTNALVRAGWKVYSAEEGGGLKKVYEAAALSPEGLVWSVIITASGEFDINLWDMHYALLLLIRHVLHAPLDLKVLMLLRGLAELLSYTCDAITWIDAMVFLHCIYTRLDASEDVSGLISRREEYAHDIAEVLRRRPAGGLSELAWEHEDLLECFPDESARGVIVAYMEEVYRSIARCFPA